MHDYKVIEQSRTTDIGKSMKITFLLINHNLSGGNKVIAIYADRLARMGHDVTVIAGRHRKPTLRQKVKSLAKGEKWPTVYEDDTHFRKIAAKVTQIEKHRPVTNDDVPDGDIVIATFWETVEWARDLGPSKGTKIHFVQGHEVNPAFPSEIRSRIEEAYKLPFKKITISNWLKKTMGEVYGDSNVAVIHNSVDTAQFSAPRREKNGRPTLGILYSTTYFKCLSDGLAVIDKVKRAIPELRVLMFGAHAPIKDLALPDYAEFSVNPPQHQIKDIYSRCDVWLCSSIAEGFYLPLLEAMACRCPVVSTRVGGPADIIEHGKNGFLAEVHDIDALTAHTIDVLSMSGDRWHAMSQAAYETATGYTWDDAASRFEKALLAAVDPAP